MYKHSYTVKRGENLYSISRKVNCSIENLAAWNNKNLSKPVIKPGEKLIYYINASEKKKQHKQVSAPGGTILYKVKKGDTFYSLAKLYSVEISDILSLNNLRKKSIIRPGDVIYIPSHNNKRNNNSADKNIIYYTIKKGDNLWTIAKQFGVLISTICKVNNLTKKSLLMPGKIIKIILSESL
jgi:membrane-bound lytic murein transglycosylase D